MSENNHKEERIAKVMARAGLCSRRDAEKWIAAGRVSVNGKPLDTPAFKVSTKDTILVDGKTLQAPEATRLFLYHKPVGLITSHRDEQGRETIFDKLPKHLPRLISVGRLDLNSEGLLLLTNDGGLSRHLELPATGWKRQYRVRVLGNVDEHRLKSLKNGITVEGVRYKSIDAQLEKDQSGANTWISVTLSEGKNREIRRVMEALNLEVNRLIRTAYGPFELERLSRLSVSEVSPETIQTLIPTYAPDSSTGHKPS
jgi:23S rRNA pseudouridine2605 synthase